MAQVYGQSNLYILVFPKKGVMKIGKANSIHNRIGQLQKYWGKILYKSSYSIKMETEMVFKLEKSLHFFLSKHSVEFDEGDGKTEFFSIEGKAQALEHIKLYLQSVGNLDALKKGIQKPIFKSQSPKRSTFPNKIFYNDAERCIDTWNDSIARMKKFFILIKILLRYQSKIPFQYDFVDGKIFFRIKYKSPSELKLIKSMRQCLSFYIRDSISTVCWNVCNPIYNEDDVAQIELDIESEGRFRTRNYINTLIMNAILNLPKKSEAATDDLPILDTGWPFTSKKSRRSVVN